MRLCSYWVPRYIFAKKVPEAALDKRGYYEIAMRYLQGSLDKSVEIVQSKIIFLLLQGKKVIFTGKRKDHCLGFTNLESQKRWLFSAVVIIFNLLMVAF